MIPTSYTVSEFISYLRNEVIYESAEGLGWPDVIPAEIHPPEVRTVDTSTTDQLTLTAALTHDVPYGSIIIFSDGFVRTTKSNALVGGTTLDITPDIVAGDADDNDILIEYNPNQQAVPNPKFTAIVDEALRQMGLENIEQIKVDNIRVFRLLGRLELLRRIAENRVPTYDASYSWWDEDRSFVERKVESAPSLMTQQITQLYKYELESLSAEINQSTTTTEVPVRGIPSESLSQSSGVSVKW